MLKKSLPSYQPTGILFVMSDIAVLTAAVKTALLEIAKQASGLGTGLQNAAPGEKQGTPNHSIQYLLSTADNLAKLAEECEKIIAEAKEQ